MSVFKDFRPVVVFAAITIFAAGCASGGLSQREKGAGAGAVIGAGAGAIIGNQSGDAGEGALIGAALGGLTGAILGDQQQAGSERRSALEQRQYEQEEELRRQREEIEQLKREQGSY